MKKALISTLLLTSMLFGAIPAFAEDSVGLQAGPAKAVIKEDIRQGSDVPISSLFIENTGSLRERFTITTEGGMTVEKSTLILNPKQKVFLKASIAPELFSTPGKTAGKIIVSATEDEGKGIQHNPAVELEFNYNLAELTFTDVTNYIQRKVQDAIRGYEYILFAGFIMILLIVGIILKRRKPKMQNEMNSTT
ncbi:hypothetical protein [Brevibacillus reuszeri]|uniref:hypothetical protein n=1 Tax=Brevibacillus reuszeri TaxID=54915 RepID=UPI000CCC4896|nr:hypothetical protein [Brevibacillus reuszeri]